MILTPDQELASSEFTKFMESPDEKYMVIQGSAGSGKSTLIRYLLDKMRTIYNLTELLLPGSSSAVKINTALTATTNKAAAVLEDMLDEQTSTIHSFLKLVLRSDYETGKVRLAKGKDFDIIKDTLVIIDEASFIDYPLFSYIENTLMNCKVLLIGDYYQLAPVKQKETIMENLKCRKVVMSKIMRNSGIIMETGAQFRDTVISNVFKPIVYDTDNLIHVDGDTFKSLIDEAFSKEDYSINSAKILAWRNEKVIAYNKYIRELKKYSEYYQPNEIVVTNKPILNNQNRVLHATDSHVKIDNISDEICRYGVLGHIITISGVEIFSPINQTEVWSVLKDLAKDKNWTRYFEIKDRWLDLRPPFSSTVHKAQGSTYKEVFIDLGDIGRCKSSSDVARMLYVAISRASHKVILYGDLPLKYTRN